MFNNNKRKKIIVITKPDPNILKKVILAFNKDLENGKFKWLARNKKIPLEEANLWLERYMRGRQLVSIVINDKGEPLGAGHINRLHGRKSHVGIISVTVFNRYRRKGIGKLIYKNLIEQAKDNKITRIESEPVENNSIAIDLEKKFGFYLECVQKNKYKLDEGDYLDCHLMVLYINDRRFENEVKK